MGANNTSTQPKGIGTKGLIFEESLLFELSSPGRKAYSLPSLDVPETDIKSILPQEEIRDEIKNFPELSELDVVRHYTRLSQWNFSIETNFYPLGSCTMKYNPKINDQMAQLSQFSQHHPATPEALSQGSLELMHDLEAFLKEISGMDSVCLQPAAGAQGELAGMLMIHAWHQSKGAQRKKVLLPDSAHGTNPASSALCGYDVVSIPSDSNGFIDLEFLENAMDEDVAGIMLTNPNTLGKFEKDIIQITDIVHKKGGLVYCDGANLNAIMGMTKMGEMGIDVMHFNLHKTFSTPHGGGGPGAGPVGVKKILEPFLPVPVIEKRGANFHLNYERPQSIGKLKAFYGNFGILLRAYVYILSLGKEGIKKACQMAVLNANYIRSHLEGIYHQPYPGDSLHECIFSDKDIQSTGVKTLDIAKTLIDYGIHPPTVYFPLIAKGAIMIEPTETESKETLDLFIKAMKEIAENAIKDPDSFRNAPKLPKVSRLDETKAARDPVLRWMPKNN